MEPPSETSHEIGRTELLRAHYEFQAGSFITDLQELPGGVVAHSDVTPIPMWNHAAWWGGEGSDLGQFLAEASRRETERNRRPVVYVENPAEAQEILAEGGFERFDQEAWMVFAGEAPATVWPEGLRATTVQGESEFHDFIRAFNAAYQVRETSYGTALREGQKRGHRHYVLYAGTEAVCVATAAQEGEVACIYNMGTPPAARQKGYAGRLMTHILRELQEAGAARIFLQVEHQSAPQRLYQKLGFETQFVRHGFRLRDWRPQTSERSHLSRVLGFHSEKKPASTLAAREAKPLAPQLATCLHDFCKGQGIRMEDLFALAWASVLHRYTGEETVQFGVSENGGAFAGRAFTFDATTPLLDILRAQSVQTNPHELSIETGLRFSQEIASARFGGSQLPLEICVAGTPAASLEIGYRADQFSKDSIRRLGAHLVNVLQRIATKPRVTIAEVELLTPEEKHQLLVEWNRTAFAPTDKSIPDLFEAQVEREPDLKALSFARAGVKGPVEELTYREVNHRANRLARFLQTAGVGPEVFVGVCMDRSLDMVVALLAILKAGGACVPMDPAYPTDRIAYMVRDTAAPIILTQSHLAPVIGERSHARIVCLDQEWARLSRESEKNLSSRVRPEHAAYVIYTSGSTGQPKGVVIPHRSIANHCLDCVEHYRLNPKDRILQFSSFNFDAAFEQILPALIAGAKLVLRDNEVWTTREFGNKLQEFELTVADIPTAYWHELAERWHADPGSMPPNSLRLVVVGGEALAPEKLALWQETPMNRVRLVNAYGPTETTITATSYNVPPRGAGEAAAPVLPIGRPRGNRKAYVLDGYGSPTPIGVPGELHIGGGMLARGYHKRPDLTDARFIADPFSDDPDARLYKTGDLVRYLPDGNLEFLGRVDDQVKIRGFRIELGEIESTLRTHPGVREAMVLARTGSGGEKRLAGYVVANGTPPDRQELRRFLRQKLPEYMVPAGLVVLEEWPLLPNGKIDRRALPDPQEETVTGAVNGPRDPLELQIQLTFERVLRRAPIPVDASFFELGGDSLQALELLVEIERATGKSLPLGTLYQSSTVEALAREVTCRSEGEEWSSLVPLQSSGNRPPLFLLHTTPGDILAYGNLVYRLGPDQPCYGLQSLGLKESQLSHRTIEEMTVYYTDLLQKFQPHGPYYLGGWCYGGIIAVEMARLLKQRGEKVALLALLETVAMPPAYSNLAYYRHRVRCFLSMTPRRWVVYFREKLRYSREARIANRMRFRQVENGTPLEGEIRDPRLARLEHVYNTNLKALTDYKSTFYDGTVTLFNAVERDPAVIADPKYGWVGLARGIEVHEVPGDHDSMLSEPNVSALAARLSECLLRAQNSHSENQAHT